MTPFPNSLIPRMTQLKLAYFEVNWSIFRKICPFHENKPKADCTKALNKGYPKPAQRVTLSASMNKIKYIEKNM